jgi:hypothetical protein
VRSSNQAISRCYDAAVAPGGSHHAERVFGLPDVTVAEDGDLGDRLLELGDRLPARGAVVELGRGASMQRDGGTALFLSDATSVEEAEVALVDAHPELDGHGDVLAGLHGSSNDAAQQVGLDRDGRAAPLAGDLSDWAAEVHVDVVDPAFAHQTLDRLGDEVGVDAVQLKAAGRFVLAEVGQLEGLAVAHDQRPRRDHLADVQASDRACVDPAQKSTADRPERVVGDPSHRCEHDRRPYAHGPELERVELTLARGGHVGVDRAAVLGVHGPGDLPRPAPRSPRQLGRRPASRSASTHLRSTYASARSASNSGVVRSSTSKGGRSRTRGSASVLA